jgi:hypothetical protein
MEEMTLRPSYNEEKQQAGLRASVEKKKERA